MKSVFIELNHDGIAGIEAEGSPEGSWNDQLASIDNFDRS